MTELVADAELAAAVAAECEKAQVPGCAVGVLVDGSPRTAAYGVTSTTDPLPVDSDTLFLIGSTTKTLTATTVMTLVEDGLVALDDPVVRHLPTLRLADAAAREAVTVGQLLDHTAGWRGDAEVDTGFGDDALARAVDELVPSLPQHFAPGQDSSYNNAALLVAGRLVEMLTGMTYEAAVRERVFEPLGMTSSFFHPWELLTRRLAVGHVLRDSGPEPAHTWPTTRALGPAGGCASTVRDQLRYAAFHVDGTASARAPLSAEARQLMQRKRVTLRSARSGFGISWLLRSRMGLDLVEHGGNCSNLHVSTFSMAPAKRFAVTVLTNSRGGTAVGAAVLNWALQHYLGGKPPAAPEPLPVTEAVEADYVGSYDAGQWRWEVTARDQRLFVQMVLTDIPADTPADVIAAFTVPPTEVVLVAPDIIAPATAPADSAGDFIRDADNRVTGLRYGMRLARRVPMLPQL